MVVDTKIIEELKARYELVISSTPDTLFYRNLHHYFDLIIKTPVLKERWDKEVRFLRDKQIELDEQTELTEEEYNDLLKKQESFSFYHYGARIFFYVYDLIEEYKNSPDPDQFQEPSVLLMLKGPEGFKAKNWFRRLYESLPKINLYGGLVFITEGRKFLTKKQALRQLHLERIAYENRLKQFHMYFLGALYEMNGEALSLVVPEVQEIYFIEDKSTLSFLGTDIKLSLKADKTNAHYLMKLIMANPQDRLHYSDIPEEIFYPKEKWRQPYRAAQDIADKIFKATKANDFLIIKSGKTGYVEISPEYIDLLRLR